jgi:uncharacterized protein YdaU (DUF1376 family)
MNKPPAFQFYVKGWRSSPTIRTMSLAEIGLYTQLLAASWDSDEPGTLPPNLREIAKITGIELRILRKFFAKYPGLFPEVSGKFRNWKLYEQALKYKEISQKRSSAAQSRYPAIAEQKHHPASAPAFASASATKGGYSLMQLSQDRADVKLHEPVSTPSQIKNAIRNLAKQLDGSASDDQRTHIESGIFRKKIGDAYFDATRAGMTPDECMREAITAGALTLVGNRSVELKGLSHQELAEQVWNRIRNNLSALHEVKNFETRSRQVVGVVTRNLSDLASEFWKQHAEAITT